MRNCLFCLHVGATSHADSKTSSINPYACRHHLQQVLCWLSSKMPERITVADRYDTMILVTGHDACCRNKNSCHDDMTCMPHTLPGHNSNSAAATRCSLCTFLLQPVLLHLLLRQLLICTLQRPHMPPTCRYAGHTWVGAPFRDQHHSLNCADAATNRQRIALHARQIHTLPSHKYHWRAVAG